MSAEALKTKEQLRSYLASAELQEVLRNTLSNILKRDDLPSAQQLVRTLGEELLSVSEEAEASADDGTAADDEEERRMMAMRGKRRTGVSAESTNAMQAQEKPSAQKTEKTAEQKERIERAIGGNLLFEGINGPQKEELFALMFEKTVEPGVSVITQGEEGDNFYVVDSGACDIFVNGNKVGECTDGDSFGELALMYSAPRAATITTTAATALWAMDRITFRSMLFDKANAKREQYKVFLNSVPLLEPMEPYEKEKIADVLETVEVADGEAVVTEGEEGDTFYIVVEGTESQWALYMPHFECWGLQLHSFVRVRCACCTGLRRGGHRHQARRRHAERGEGIQGRRLLWRAVASDGPASRRLGCRQRRADMRKPWPEAVYAPGRTM